MIHSAGDFADLLSLLAWRNMVIATGRHLEAISDLYRVRAAQLIIDYTRSESISRTVNWKAIVVAG